MAKHDIMRKILILSLSLTILCQGYSQTTSHIKGKAIGLSFFLNDFQTASDIRTMGLTEVINDGNLFNTSRMNSGFAANYLSGISKHMDFIATLGGSSFKYPVSGVPAFTKSKLYLETTAGINFKLLSDKYIVVPFMDLGVGAGKYDKYFSAFIPAGVGLQVNFSDAAFLLLNSQYRIPVTERANYHFYHSLGVVATISHRKETNLKLVEIPEVQDRIKVKVKDRDGDGVVDSLDACPDEPGLVALKGCPDRDGDGIADKDDKCPDVPGVARYSGCPIPDSDGDGVNDEIDKCPHQAGPASNDGCPLINDKDVEMINRAAKNIYFSTGSHKFQTKSFNSLRSVVLILKDNPGYKMKVEGYTDNTGNADKNKKLSGERANAVKDYFVENGVDASRISAIGYGQMSPIADNNTADGRAKNRRVEVKLSN